jgi:tight adherence protein B
MNIDTLGLKLIGALALAGGVFVASWCIVTDRQSLPYRYWALYIAYLARKLRLLMLANVTGSLIAKAQLAASTLVVAAAFYFARPEIYLALGVVMFTPLLVLEQRRVARINAIEAKMDGFILTLANALKSTPSIGSALIYAQPLLAPPLNEEVELALKEIRVGSTVEQALTNMSSRIRSTPLDAALSGIMIGRQVGGDLTQILETTAATLREMARLQGIVKAKTAEGKGQLMVLAVFPAVILVLFDTLSPGYFRPLTNSTAGYFITFAAIALWVGAVILARNVLAVEV